MADDSIILKTENLVKEFKGFVAVNDVSLQVKRGDIHALIGPNGAGKTTLFNCLSRLYTPSGGDVLFEGKSILGRPRHDIADQDAASSARQPCAQARQAEVRRRQFRGGKRESGHATNWSPFNRKQHASGNDGKRWLWPIHAPRKYTLDLFNPRFCSPAIWFRSCKLARIRCNI